MYTWRRNVYMFRCRQKVRMTSYKLTLSSVCYDWSFIFCIDIIRACKSTYFHVRHGTHFFCFFVFFLNQLRCRSIVIPCDLLHWVSIFFKSLHIKTNKCSASIMPNYKLIMEKILTNYRCRLCTTIGICHDFRSYPWIVEQRELFAVYKCNIL